MRSDAWRCMTDNAIHDPCFDAGLGVQGLVACAYSPKGKITVLQVGELPFDSANEASGTSGLPWAVELANGTPCVFASGAGSMIGDKRSNYACEGPPTDLWGDPERHEDRRWQIFGGAFSKATELTQVEIAIAWF